jgi:RND family efflux transporter MFP subunit
MDRGRGRLRQIVVMGLAAAGLIAAGAVGATLVLRTASGPQPGPAAEAPAPAESPTAAPPAAGTPTTGPSGAGVPAAEATAAEAPSGEVEVVLSPEAVAQAGIKTAPAAAVESGASVQVPGSVTANAYREVKVIPLVGGIVTKVHVELGTAVARGTPLATIFSAELADAQTKYLSMAAMIEADRKKLDRTRALVEIGAASRQELEEVTAAYASRATEVEAARQRLLLLGLTHEQVEALGTPGQVVSEIVVPAPIDGVITSRSANLGQVVGMGQELFVVTDLSTVWVVGDLYEQDFQRVRVGSKAAITTPAYPGLTLRGRVTYIDPRVDPQTRTAKVRVEVPNREGRLKLGMYVTLSFTTAGGKRQVVVPRTAVQTIGKRHVVFVAVKDEEGKFIQRDVQVGQMVGDSYTIVGGIQPGEEVVTEGSFFLRSESLRNSPS